MTGDRRREIQRFFWPLVLSGQLITLSQPFINAAIGHAPEAVVALASFSLAFNFAVMLNSPVIMTQNVATAVIRDRRTFGLVRGSFLAVGIAAGLADLVIGLTSAGDWLFSRVFGHTNPAIIAGAKSALVVLSAMSPAIALRGAYQGAALASRLSERVAVATAVRLGAIFTIAWSGWRWFGLKGEVAGALAISAGVWAECLTLVGQRGTARDAAAPAGAALRDAAPSPATEPTDLVRLIRFAWPLVLGHVSWSAQRPIINALLGTLADREAATAAFAVLHPLLLFTSAPMLALQSTAVVFGKSDSGRRTVFRFGLAVAAVLSLATILTRMSGGAAGILGFLFNLQGHVLALSLAGFALVAVDPLAQCFKVTATATLMNLGQTRPVGFAASVKVFLIVAGGLAAARMVPDINGAALGMGLFVAGSVCDALIIGLIARRRWQAARPERDIDAGGQTPDNPRTLERHPCPPR